MDGSIRLVLAALAAVIKLHSVHTSGGGASSESRDTANDTSVEFRGFQAAAAGGAETK